jgi:hypothetical protein
MEIYPRSHAMCNRLSRRSRAATFLVVALSVAAAFVTQKSTADDVARRTIDRKRVKSGQAGRLFELRIYTAASGKMEALHKRFRDHTLPLFEKHGIKSVGYWTTADKQDEERLYYIVTYPDRTSREKMLTHGIAVDPEFLRVVAESERHGKLTTRIESILLTPTDYSALK